MSGFSTITRSLGLCVLTTALLTACGSSTGAITSPAATTSTAAASTTIEPMTTSTTPEPAVTSAAMATAMPTVEPTTQPSPAIEPTTSATMAAMDHSQHAAAAGAKINLDIKLFMFKPSPLEVKPGTTLIWTNQDAIDHSVTAGTPGSLSGAFDSDFFGQGQAFEFTFNEPGTYDYFCKRHESMVGTIVVTAS